MVVPAANGYDLLKEHAWYEYGYEEYQSVMDFDYTYGKNDSITPTSNTTFRNICLILLVPIISYFLITRFLKFFKLHDKNSNKYDQTIHSSNGLTLNKPFQYLAKKRHIKQNSDDLESGNFIPELSHSNSPTPSSSPQLSREHLTSIKTYILEDHSNLKSTGNPYY